MPNEGGGTGGEAESGEERETDRAFEVRKRGCKSEFLMLNQKVKQVFLIFNRAVDPDPHSFSLLDLDPERKYLRKKLKNERKLVVFFFFFNHQ